MALLDSAPAKRAAAPACLVATALVLSACGSTTGSDLLNTGIKSGRRALAANAAQPNEIVGQGSSDLKRRLGALRGHPVVINQWASWCTSCRFELGFFDKASKRFRDRVAFLGLDSQDDRKDGATFIKHTPGGFPSIFDPDGSLASSFGGGRAFPATFFIDRSGKQVGTHIGAYASTDALVADIERYALESSDGG